MLNDTIKESSPYISSLHGTLLKECGEMVPAADMVKANVLEIGCGYGATTVRIAERFPNIREVLGIDADQEAIQYAFTYVADEKMDFAKADIEDQTTFDMLWASKFDFVFSSNTLLFVRDHAASLRNLMWCLKPGGKCFLALPAAKPEDFHSAAKKVFTADCWKKHFKPMADVLSDTVEPNCNRLWFHHPHADRVYSALLEQVGYQVLSTRLIDFKHVFSSADEYKECLEFLIKKPLQCVPEDKRARLLKEFLKAATKKAKKLSKGPIMWNIKYVLVLAKRPEL